MDPSSITSLTANAIKSALAEINVQIKDITEQSNYSAFVTFDSLHRATLAQHCFEDGSVQVKADATSGSVGTTSAISVYPAYVVAVEQFSPDVPVTEISSLLKEHGIKAVSIDRSAILKFKRHMEVVPGMKVLKTLKLGGLQLQPMRYRKLEQGVKDVEYDVYGEDEVFDSESLRQTMKDYLHMDPSTRLAIAKNSFERALTTAKANDDSSFLHDDKAPPEIQNEIIRLMKSDKPNSDRLFELFLQRDDMHRLAHDFREMQALTGDPLDNQDLFSWSNFKIEDDEELLRLRDAMLLAQKDALEGTTKTKKGKLLTTEDYWEKVGIKVKETPDDVDVTLLKTAEELAAERSESGLDADENDDGNDISITKEQADLREDRIGQDEDEIQDEESSPEDLVRVTDRDGYVWSGVVLNTDTTTTTLPAGRFMTHRALVMVGNLKGAGGFGMGKGENAQLALKRAFRDAVKNVFFIDLYDNAALAHDLYGRHNACHVYIRATPRERPMVGSSVSRAILTRFGISSASVKIVGRRDPYAVARAFTYALQKHENLDEFARDRGLRYLTLRWIYDNKI